MLSRGVGGVDERQAYREARADDPRIAAMRDWLLHESREGGTSADPVRVEASQ